MDLASDQSIKKKGLVKTKPFQEINDYFRVRCQFLQLVLLTT
ncbi:hypothetical protein VagYM19_10360 [Vibrio alginolyticus]|nr:hypothetical protein Vag1382_10350 [Vibrio alginolyticus]BCB46509.1 hypothetical protein VagVIO5_10350 [Vibrio alginolyticus]BCB51110.1 hypothetical protein VagYM19_10360 [Vibrio alginolyticus]BCB55713.1 hypothetical protein VagYM4_10360 [Vibrio alginolyticus]